MNRCRSGVMVYLHGWKRETPRANPERTWRNRATRPGNHTCKASTSDVHQQQQEREDNERRKAEATAERFSSTTGQPQSVGHRCDLARKRRSDDWFLAR